MSPHDFLDDTDDELPTWDELPAQAPADVEPVDAEPVKTSKRASKRAQRKAAREAHRLAERRRLTEMHRNPPPGRALGVVFVVALGIIVLAWWVPQLTAQLGTEPERPIATPSPTPDNPEPTPSPTEAAQSVADSWARAYFRGGQWQELSVPASVPTLAQQREDIYFGADSPLPADGVRVEEVLFREGEPAEAVDGAAWPTTLDVLFDLPNRTAGAFTLTLEYDGETWHVASLAPEFIGEV